MRTNSNTWLAWIATAALGCGMSPNHNEVPATPDADNTTGTALDARCRMVDPAYAYQPQASEEIVGIAGGPHGYRVLSRRGWWDASESGLHSLGGDAALVWTGANYLGVSARNVSVFDTEMNPVRVVGRLPAFPCDAQMIDVGGAAALLYRQVPRANCGLSGAAGPVYFQRVRNDGTMDGPALRLGRSNPDRALALSLRARLDAGRIVVLTGDEHSTQHFAVLSLEGQELIDGDAEIVACPRVGCVRFMGRGTGTSGSPSGRADSGNLWVEVLVGAPGFELPLVVDRVKDVAVLGDRVLLRYNSSAAGDDPSGDELAVVDLAQRRVNAIYDAGRQSTLTSVHDERLNWRMRLAATRDTFVVTGGDGVRGISQRWITCH